MGRHHGAGIGLAIAAVIGVIAIFQLLYNKVEPFEVVNALGDIVKTVVGKIVDFFMLLPKAVMKVVGMIRKFFGRGFGAIAKDTIKAVANLALQWFTLPLKVAQVVSKIIAHFTGIDLFQAGADALTSMWEGFKNIWPRFKDWLVNGFKEAVGNIAGRLDPRNWFGGGDDGQQQQPSAIDGERAMGGPVRRGGSYLVGGARAGVVQPYPKRADPEQQPNQQRPEHGANNQHHGDGKQRHR